VVYEQEMKKIFLTNAPETYIDKDDFIKKSQERIGKNNPNEKFLKQEIQ